MIQNLKTHNERAHKSVQVVDIFSQIRPDQFNSILWHHHYLPMLIIVSRKQNFLVMLKTWQHWFSSDSDIDYLKLLHFYIKCNTVNNISIVWLYVYFMQSWFEDLPVIYNFNSLRFLKFPKCWGNNTYSMYFEAHLRESRV